MQAGTNTAGPADGEQLRNILGRFQAWSDTTPTHTKRHGGPIGEDGVRELSCDEALRQLRNRRAAATERKPIPTVAANTAALPSVPAAGTPTPTTVAAPTAQLARVEPALMALTEQPLATAKPPLAKPLAPKEKTPPVAARPVRAAKPARAANIGDKAPRTAKTTPALQTRAIAKESPTAKAKKAGTAPPPNREASALRLRVAERKQPEIPPSEFRHVLAKTVRAKNPLPEKAAKATKQKPAERELRVSVRLTSAEELRLQQYAARAGLTVSAYLRKKALEGEEIQDHKPVPQLEMAAVPRLPGRVAAAAAPSPARSGLGDWLTLLRNRFLSSPARFAERA